ncbi:hypothetical protein ABPG72_019692 [Tetrahymena utriculariae]
MSNILPDLSKSLVNENIFIIEKIDTKSNNSNIQYYNGHNQEKQDEICIKQLFQKTISSNQQLKNQFEQEQQQFQDYLPVFLQKNYEYMESSNDEYYLISSPLFETINKQKLPMGERVAKGIFLQLIEAFYELHLMNLEHFAICFEHLGYNVKNGKVQLQRFGFESHYIFRNQPFEEEEMFLSPQFQRQMYLNQRYSSLSQDMFNLGAIMQTILLGIPNNQRIYQNLPDQLKELLVSMTNPIEEKRMKWENLLDHAYFSLGQSQPYEMNRIQSHYNQRVIKNFYRQNDQNVSSSIEILRSQDFKTQLQNNYLNISEKSPIINTSQDVQIVNFEEDKSQAEISFVSIANQVMDERFSQQPFQVQNNYNTKKKEKKDEKSINEARKQERISFQQKQGQILNEFLSQQKLAFPQNAQDGDINSSNGIIIFQNKSDIQNNQNQNILGNYGSQQFDNTNQQQSNSINQQHIGNFYQQSNNLGKNQINNQQQQQKISEAQISQNVSQQKQFNFSKKKSITYDNYDMKNTQSNNNQNVVQNNNYFNQNTDIRIQRSNTDQNINFIDRNSLQNIQQNNPQNQQSPININKISTQQQDENELQQNPYHIIKDDNLIPKIEIKNSPAEEYPKNVQQNSKLNSNNQQLQPDSINKSVGNKTVVNSIQTSKGDTEIKISKSRQEYQNNLNLMNQLTQYFMNERNKYSFILNTCLLIYQQPESFFSKKDCFEHLINYTQLLNSLSLNYDLLSQLVDLTFQQKEYTPQLIELYKNTTEYQNIYKLLQDDAFIIETWLLAAFFDLDEFKNLQNNSRLAISGYYLKICNELFKFVSKNSIIILIQIFEAQQPENQTGEMNFKWNLSKANIEKITNLRKSFSFNFNQDIAIQLLDLQILYIKTGLEKKNSNITLQDVSSYKILFFLLYIKKHFNAHYVPQRIKLINAQQNQDFDCGQFFDKINVMTDYIEIKKLISEITKAQK